MSAGPFVVPVDVLLATNIQRLSIHRNIGKNFSLFSRLANTGEAGGIVLVFSVAPGGTVIGMLVMATAFVGRVKSGVMS